MLHVYVFISTSSSLSFLLSCLLLFVSLFGWLVPFQLSKEAENAVNKSRGLLDDIVRENKGNVLSNAYKTSCFNRGSKRLPHTITRGKFGNVPARHLQVFT